MLRSNRRGRRVLVGVVAVGVLLAGSAPAALAVTTPKIGPSFVAKANRTCAGFLSSLNKVEGTTFPYPSFDPAHPQKSLLKKVGHYFDKGLEIERSIPGKLRALGEPKKGAKSWNRLRSLADRFDRLAEKQARDASAGDAKGFVAAARKITSVLAKLSSEAPAAGFPKGSECAQYFG